MAESEQGQQQDPAAAEEAAERGPTMRVVVQREDVLVLPEGVSAEQVQEAAVALGLAGTQKKPKTVKPAEAWVVVGEFVGAAKDAAIEAYAGKAGTDTARIGAWKAPTVRAWAGGVKHTAPPKPLVEKEAIA